MDSIELPTHLNEVLDHVEATVKGYVSTLAWRMIMATGTVVVLGAIGWGVHQEKVAHNEREIMELRQNAAVFMTRTDIEDLLSGRDARLDNIEKSLDRIERSLGTK